MRPKKSEGGLPLSLLTIFLVQLSYWKQCTIFSSYSSCQCLLLEPLFLLLFPLDLLFETIFQTMIIFLVSLVCFEFYLLDFLLDFSDFWLSPVRFILFSFEFQELELLQQALAVQLLAFSVKYKLDLSVFLPLSAVYPLLLSDYLPNSSVSLFLWLIQESLLDTLWIYRCTKSSLLRFLSEMMSEVWLRSIWQWFLKLLRICSKYLVRQGTYRAAVMIAIKWWASDYLNYLLSFLQPESFPYLSLAMSLNSVAMVKCAMEIQMALQTFLMKVSSILSDILSWTCLREVMPTCMSCPKEKFYSYLSQALLRLFIDYSFLWKTTIDFLALQRSFQLQFSISTFVQFWKSLIF